MVRQELQAPLGGIALRAIGLDDEGICLDAVEAMRPFAFLLAYDQNLSWGAYLDKAASIERGIETPGGRLRARQLLATEDAEVVGAAYLNFELTRDLQRRGGHVGYCVLPRYRGCGRATRILDLGLDLLRGDHVTRALVTCTDDNHASARVIEKCGGTLETVVTGDDGAFRRYWIDLSR